MENRMPSSLEWRLYYEENARSLLEIPWQLGPELTPEETSAIAQSLKEFQAGENSEGKHLFRYAQEYAQRTGDHEYVPVIRLFIAEEQRHGAGHQLLVRRRQEELSRVARLQRVAASGVDDEHSPVGAREGRIVEQRVDACAQRRPRRRSDPARLAG